MKNKSIKVFIAICFTLFLTSCNSQNAKTDNNAKSQNAKTDNKDESQKIQEIKYSIYGGWIGLGFNLKLTPDSINYFYSIDHSNKKGNFDTIMSSELWNQLLNVIDLPSFETMESGSTRQIFDGSDQKIIITTSKKEISVINWTDSESIKEFYNKISILESECRKKTSYETDLTKDE